jgi:hypothetical protein
LVIEIVTWGVASGIYKQQDQGQDLWGFSCGMKKEGGSALDAAREFVDFASLCRKQVSRFVIDGGSSDGKSVY